MTRKNSDGPIGGPIVTTQWITGTSAVNAFRTLCGASGWVFTEVAQQADFGKDGYVDIAVDGELTGFCVAVQIKGGRSFRTRYGYRITATERQRNFWKFSTTPVFGIVWDEDDGHCYWANITEQLWRSDKKPIRVEKSKRLPETATDFMDAAFHASVGSEVAAALGSDDEDSQLNAISDIRALGRHDHRQLVLLRRVMFGLQPQAIDFSIATLNDVSLNMDLLKTADDVALGQKVRPSFRWTVDEAVALLDRVYDDGNGYFARGTFGAAVYWLIVGDEPHGDHYRVLVERAAHRAALEGYYHSAEMGLILLAFWAQERGLAAVEAFLDEHPDMRSRDQVMHLVDFLESHGCIEL